MAEAEALVLNRSSRCSKRESALEEAWLLADLQQRFGHSLEELASKFDRSVSWVSCRLALVELLPQSVQQQVRSGEISAQVATKYLLPVARSSLQECRQMAAAFARGKFSTRQAGQLYAGPVGPLTGCSKPFQFVHRSTRAKVESGVQNFEVAHGC